MTQPEAVEKINEVIVRLATGWKPPPAWNIKELNNIAGPDRGVVNVCTSYPKYKALAFGDGSGVVQWMDYPEAEYGRDSRCEYGRVHIHLYRPETGWAEITPNETGVDILQSKIMLNGSVQMYPSGEDGFVLVWTYEQYDSASTSNGDRKHLCGGKQVYLCWRTVMMEWNNGQWSQLKQIYNDSLTFQKSSFLPNGDGILVFLAWAKTPQYAPLLSQETSRLVVVKRVGGVWQSGEIGSEKLGTGTQKHTVKIVGHVNGQFQILWNGRTYSVAVPGA